MTHLTHPYVMTHSTHWPMTHSTHCLALIRTEQIASSSNLRLLRSLREFLGTYWLIQKLCLKKLYSLIELVFCFQSKLTDWATSSSEWAISSTVQSRWILIQSVGNIRERPRLVDCLWTAMRAHFSVATSSSSWTAIMRWPSASWKSIPRVRISIIIFIHKLFLCAGGAPSCGVPSCQPTLWPVQKHKIFNLPWSWRVGSRSLSSLYVSHRVTHRSMSPVWPYRYFHGEIMNVR